jgi:hypothetical protein
MIFLLSEQQCGLSLSLFLFSNQPLPASDLRRQVAATARYMRF